MRLNPTLSDEYIKGLAVNDRLSPFLKYNNVVDQQKALKDQKSASFVKIIRSFVKGCVNSMDFAWSL